MGALLTVFAIVPAFGIRGASLFAATLNLTLAVAALVIAARSTTLQERPDPTVPASAETTPDARLAFVRQVGVSGTSMIRAGAIVAAVAGLAVALPQDRLATLLATAREGQLVFYDESPGGTVAVIEQASGNRTLRRLYIQGVSNTGDAVPSRRYMRLQAMIPLLVHPREPKSALVIGLGTGITAGVLLTYPKLERRVAVELLRPVAEAAPLFQGNFGAGTDPRLDVEVADGRHWLMRSEERFDLITLEPSPPAAAGVVNLYSRDFYELARERLAEGGVLAQWWPITTQNDEDSQSLVKSMVDVFPHVTLWSTEVHEMMLLGSMEPIPLDFSRVAEHFRTPSIAEALREVGVHTPADMLATYVTDHAGLVTYAGEALPVTDDRPADRVCELGSSAGARAHPPEASRPARAASGHRVRR